MGQVGSEESGPSGRWLDTNRPELEDREVWGSSAAKNGPCRATASVKDQEKVRDTSNFWEWPLENLQ